MVRNTKVRVAVLMGGTSAEREISILSGEAVSSALSELGHEVTKVIVDDELLHGVSTESTDVMFIALHGGAGEDGRIQTHLEDVGIPYTGSGPEASKRAMNKIKTKEILKESGIPTPDYREIDSHASEDALRRAAGDLGYPVVVKPVCEGSTLGVTIVREDKDLAKAAEVALAYGEGALLETYVPGRELTVSVLGDNALPIVEIRPAREFYDFAAKYKDGGTKYATDIDLPRHVLEEVSDTALASHRTLGCRDVSRVDMRLTTKMKFFVLEVNTIPGMTRTSLLPKAAEAAGIGYGEFVNKILSMAIERS